MTVVLFQVERPERDRQLVQYVVDDRGFPGSGPADQQQVLREVVLREMVGTPCNRVAQSKRVQAWFCHGVMGERLTVALDRFRSKDRLDPATEAWLRRPDCDG